MNKQKNEQAHLIIDKIILAPLKDEMLILQNSLNSLVGKYSFLMNGDIEKTKQMLIQVFLQINQKEIEEGFSFNEKIFYDTITDETKEKIVNEAWEKFLSKMTMSELKEVED